MAQFESADNALDFLVAEHNRAQLLSAGQQELSGLAKKTLRRKGAYILGIAGHYGGRAGAIGSSNPGALIVQGTEPIQIGDRYLALRDMQEERADRIELVTTQSPGGDYRIKAEVQS